MPVRTLDIWWAREHDASREYILVVDFTQAVTAGTPEDPFVYVAPQADNWLVAGDADWPFDTTDYPPPMEDGRYRVSLSWPFGSGSQRWMKLKYTPSPADYDAGHSLISIEDDFGVVFDGLGLGFIHETAYIPVYVYFPEPSPPKPPPDFPYTDPVLNVSLGPNAITRMG